MSKYKFLPALFLSTTFILGGCFDKEGTDESEQFKNVPSEFASIDKEHPINLNINKNLTLTNTRDVIVNPNQILATYRDTSVTYKDIEKNIFNTANFDYAGYIMNHMVNHALIISTKTPSKQEITGVKNTLKTMFFIENPLSEDKDIPLPNEPSNEEVDKLIRQIEVFKKLNLNSQEASDEVLIEFYNSNAVDKSLYLNFDETKDIIRLKYYKSAVIAHESDINVHLLKQREFSFEKEFNFMDSIVDLYITNSPELSEELKKLNTSFSFVEKLSNGSEVYTFLGEKPTTLLDIKSQAIKGRLGESVINELFNIYLLENYKDESLFAETMKVIIRESNVHYFDDEFKETIHLYIALKNISLEYNLASDKAVEKYFEDNKDVFTETLHNDFSTFEHASPIIYANYVFNTKKEELDMLKYIVLSGNDFSVNEYIVFDEILNDSESLQIKK